MQAFSLAAVRHQQPLPCWLQAPRPASSCILGHLPSKAPPPRRGMALSPLVTSTDNGSSARHPVLRKGCPRRQYLAIHIARLVTWPILRFAQPHPRSLVTRAILPARDSHSLSSLLSIPCLHHLRWPEALFAFCISSPLSFSCRLYKERA